MKPVLGFAGLGALLFPVLHLASRDTMGIYGWQEFCMGSLAIQTKEPGMQDAIRPEIIGIFSANCSIPHSTHHM